MGLATLPKSTRVHILASIIVRHATNRAGSRKPAGQFRTVIRSLGQVDWPTVVSYQRWDDCATFCLTCADITYSDNYTYNIYLPYCTSCTLPNEIAHPLATPKRDRPYLSIEEYYYLPLPLQSEVFNKVLDLCCDVRHNN